MRNVKKWLFIAKLRIVVLFWCYKLGLKYKDLYGVWLALEVMLDKKHDTV